jgi:hypothetical protein
MYELAREFFGQAELVKEERRRKYHDNVDHGKNIAFDFGCHYLLLVFLHSISFYFTTTVEASQGIWQ